MQRQSGNAQRRKEPESSSSSSLGSTLLGALFAGAAIGMTAFLGYQVEFICVFCFVLF